MEEPQVRDLILRRLYEAWISRESATSLHVIRQESGWPETPYSSIVSRLEHDALIESRTFGGYCNITPAGILHCEEAGIARAEDVAANRSLRTSILEILARVHEVQGDFAGVHIDEMASTTGTSALKVSDNIHLLSQLGYADTFTMGTYKITHKGLDAVERWRSDISLTESFQSLATREPHQRGRELQHLLSALVQRSGWEVKEGVRAIGEEIDLVIHQDREYFLVETKWERDPVEASAIREFHGKLASRVDVRGLFLSMSGFTSGAVSVAESFASSRIILLAGPNDTHALFIQRKTFDDLLNEKYDALAASKKAVFD